MRRALVLEKLLLGVRLSLECVAWRGHVAGLLLCSPLPHIMLVPGAAARCMRSGLAQGTESVVQVDEEKESLGRNARGSDARSQPEWGCSGAVCALPYRQACSGQVACVCHCLCVSLSVCAGPRPRCLWVAGLACPEGAAIVSMVVCVCVGCECAWCACTCRSHCRKR